MFQLHSSILLLAGPGCITTMILLTGNAATNVGVIAVVLALVLVELIALCCLFTSVQICQWLGEDGINITGRLAGLLLAALAVQFVLNGLKEGIPLLGI